MHLPRASSTIYGFFFRTQIGYFVSKNGVACWGGSSVELYALLVCTQKKKKHCWAYSETA